MKLSKVEIIKASLYACNAARNLGGVDITAQHPAHKYVASFTLNNQKEAFVFVSLREAKLFKKQYPQAVLSKIL